MRGRGVEDQVRSFSCLGAMHNAFVAWNTLHVGRVVEQLRAEGHVIEDAMLALTTPLLRRPLHPLGRLHFDLKRIRQALDEPSYAL